MDVVLIIVEVILRASGSVIFLMVTIVEVYMLILDVCVSLP